MEKHEILRKAGNEIKSLLEQRRAELHNDGVYVIGRDIPTEAEEAWKKGFTDGYNELINDLSNLIDCDWLLECFDEE